MTWCSLRSRWCFSGRSPIACSVAPIAAAAPAALARPRDRHAPALQGSRATEPDLHADRAEHRARAGRRPATPLPQLLLGNVEPHREDCGAMWRAHHRRRRARNHLLHRDPDYRALEQDLAKDLASPPPLGFWLRDQLTFDLKPLRAGR